MMMMMIKNNNDTDNTNSNNNTDMSYASICIFVVRLLLFARRPRVLATSVGLAGPIVISCSTTVSNFNLLNL